MGVISQKLRDSARGQECTLRIPGICNGDRETTILAHLPSEVKAMGTKSDDWNSCFACSSCHEAIDNHRLPRIDELSLTFRALQRTQRIWFEMGLLSFPTTTPRPRQSSKIVAHPGHIRG